MLNNRKREDAAFAKGLMFGKAVGAKDERQAIYDLCVKLALTCWCPDEDEPTDEDEAYCHARQGAFFAVALELEDKKK